MECISPPPLTDEVLSLTLDDMADEETQRHFAQCPACAERLAEMKRLDIALQSRLRRYKCPSTKRLGEYHASLLVPEDAVVVQVHVAQCPRCQKDIEMLNQFLALPPIEDVASKIIPLWTPKNVWKPVRVQVSGNLSLKGQDSETAYDMQMGSANVFLEAKTTLQGLILTGQLVDSEVDWRGAIIGVWQGGNVRYVTTLDEMGEFRCQLLDPTPVTLYITAISGFIVFVENLTTHA